MIVVGDTTLAEIQPKLEALVRALAAAATCRAKTLPDVAPPDRAERLHASIARAPSRASSSRGI